MESSSSDSIVSIDLDDIKKEHDSDHESECVSFSEKESVRDIEEATTGDLSEPEMLSMSDHDKDEVKCNFSIDNPTPSSPVESVDPVDYYHSDCSWIESIETFIQQLNDIDYSSDHQSESFDFFAAFEDSEEEEDERNEMRKLEQGQRLLAYLAVPVLISQLLMMIILANTVNNSTSNELIPVSVVHHYHHYYHSHVYIIEDDHNKEKSFLYVFFNPFTVLLNSKYFKQASSWISHEYKKHCCTNAGGGLWSLFQEKFGALCKGIETEIGTALRVRDNLNRAVYNKVYKIAASPQYQRAVSTVSKWASTLKDRIFKN